MQSPDYLALVNGLLINIAIIISTVLTTYFLSLYRATRKAQTNLSFVVSEVLIRTSLCNKIFIGLSLGFISFILSINRIPLFPGSNGVDMRYVIIYFAVLYGSELIGCLTASSLIVFKYINYVSALTVIPFNEYFNNVVFTLLLLLVSIYLKRKGLPLLRSHFVFLVVFTLLRFSLFSIYFYPFLQGKKIIEFIIYTFLFATIFLLTTFVISVAIAVAESVHVYRHAAIYDSLTGVYNKESLHFFLDYVADLTNKDGSSLSISVIDIDNFKQVNDRFGHPVGDKALQYLGTTMLNASVEATHYICRIGGDEFAIIHREAPKEAEAFFSDLFKDLQTTPFAFDEKVAPLELSVGIAHFSFGQQLNIEIAFQAADKALYQAKENGKNQLVATYS